jgi:hypothetical protein
MNLMRERGITAVIIGIALVFVSVALCYRLADAIFRRIGRGWHHCSHTPHGVHPAGHRGLDGMGRSQAVDSFPFHEIATAAMTVAFGMAKAPASRRFSLSVPFKLEGLVFALKTFAAVILALVISYWLGDIIKTMHRALERRGFDPLQTFPVARLQATPDPNTSSIKSFGARCPKATSDRLPATVQIVYPLVTARRHGSLPSRAQSRGRPHMRSRPGL